MKRALLFSLVIVAVAAGGWRWRVVSAQRAESKVTVATGEVTRGSLVVTLPANGTLESAQEVPVRGEVPGTLIEICPDNSLVKPGDFMFQLDTKDLEDQRETLQRALTDAREALDTQQADSETQTTQSQSDVESAQQALKLAQEKAQADREKVAAQVKFAEGEMERATREWKRSQRLAQLNYIAGTKLRQAEKMYRQQEFGLLQQYAEQADVKKRTDEQVQEAQESLTMAHHSLDTAVAHSRAHLADARIDVSDAERKLADVEEKIAQCTVRAPAAGMAVIQTNDSNWPERRPYRLGDQVESSAAPVRIYDFTHMQVRCQIGEMDISRVHQGQTVYVSSPTAPDKRYKARMATVEELAQEANVWQGGTPGKKVFGALITLSETDPARLRPGMTVDLEIVLDSVREATMVPIRAVFKEKGRAFVYRAGAGGFTRVPVTTETRNDLLIEVKGDLKVGDRVALDRPPVTPAGGRRGK
jgi:HlyD family secretion protein